MELINKGFRRLSLSLLLAVFSVLQVYAVSPEIDAAVTKEGREKLEVLSHLNALNEARGEAYKNKYVVVVEGEYIKRVGRSGSGEGISETFQKKINDMLIKLNSSSAAKRDTAAAYVIVFDAWWVDIKRALPDDVSISTLLVKKEYARDPKEVKAIEKDFFEWGNTILSTSLTGFKKKTGYLYGQVQFLDRATGIDTRSYHNVVADGFNDQEKSIIRDQIQKSINEDGGVGYDRLANRVRALQLGMTAALNQGQGSGALAFVLESSSQAARDLITNLKGLGYDELKQEDELIKLAELVTELGPGYEEYEKMDATKACVAVTDFDQRKCLNDMIASVEAFRIDYRRDQWSKTVFKRYFPTVDRDKVGEDARRNIEKKAPESYKSIYDRSLFYAWASSIAIPKDNYWFAAAAEVTHWTAVGGADFSIPNLWVVTDPEEYIMISINEALMVRNFENFGSYLLDEGPVKYNGQSFGSLNGAELESKMVEIEQMEVQDILENITKPGFAAKFNDATGKAWEKAIKGISDVSSGNNNVISRTGTICILYCFTAGSPPKSIEKAMGQFESQFGDAPYDFRKLEHRVFLGKKMAEIIRADNKTN